VTEMQWFTSMFLLSQNKSKKNLKS